MSRYEVPSLNPNLTKTEQPPQRSFPLDYSEQIKSSGIGNLIENTIFQSDVVKRKMSKMHSHSGSKVRYVSVKRGNTKYSIRFPQPDSNLRYFKIENLVSGVIDEIICTETLIEFKSFIEKNGKTTTFEHSYNSEDAIDRVKGVIDEYASKAQKASRKSGLV